MPTLFLADASFSALRKSAIVHPLPNVNPHKLSVKYTVY